LIAAYLLCSDLLIFILARKENVDKPQLPFFVNFDKLKDKTLLR